MHEFRTATTAYYAAMEAMTTRLVPIVAMALDLPPDYFAQAFAELNCTIRLIQTVRFLATGTGLEPRLAATAGSVRRIL